MLCGVAVAGLAEASVADMSKADGTERRCAPTDHGLRRRRIHNVLRRVDLLLLRGNAYADSVNCPYPEHAKPGVDFFHVSCGAVPAAASIGGEEGFTRQGRWSVRVCRSAAWCDRLTRPAGVARQHSRRCATSPHEE